MVAITIAASIAIIYQILETNKIMGKQRPIRLNREYPASKKNEQKLEKYITKACPEKKSTR